MKKIVLAAGLLASLAGCSTTSGLYPDIQTSGFDNTKSIVISPHGASCTTMACPMIGASWLDKNKDKVGLVFQVVNLTAGINSSSLNIDGEIINFKNEHLTDFDYVAGTKTSKMMAVTDYNTIEKILNSKRTWIKISTSKGAFEAAVIDNGKDSKAFNALKRFNEQVNMVRK